MKNVIIPSFDPDGHVCVSHNWVNVSIRAKRSRLALNSYQSILQIKEMFYHMYKIIPSRIWPQRVHGQKRKKRQRTADREAERKATLLSTGNRKPEPELWNDVQKNCTNHKHCLRSFCVWNPSHSRLNFSTVYLKVQDVKIFTETWINTQQWLMLALDSSLVLLSGFNSNRGVF